MILGASIWAWVTTACFALCIAVVLFMRAAGKLGAISDAESERDYTQLRGDDLARHIHDLELELGYEPTEVSPLVDATYRNGATARVQACSCQKCSASTYKEAMASQWGE